ncbi:MAG: WD40 repeat domain-containing protein, partial [Rhodobacteraceae bacterium]|nr:WD40 repeat domain-containing protein [Paracoccaceae bacterium]
MDPVDGRSTGDLRILPQFGYSRGVNSIAVSADGQTIATGLEDDTARLWDASSGRELRILKGHSGSVYSTAFSPDGRTIATGSWDNTTRLWDVASGREQRILEGHSDAVYGIAFSPDGRTIATGSGDRTARLWDAASGRELLVLKRHSFAVVSVAFSPDGRIVATGSSDTSVRLWDAVSGRELHMLKGHISEVYGVAFSPDGGTVVTGSYDGIARLWDVSSGRKLHATERISAGILTVAFSPDGGNYVTGSTDGMVRIWDASSGKILRTLETHSLDVNGIAFGADGRTLLATGNAGAVQAWDATTGQEQGMFALFDDGSSIVVTPDGFFDAAGGGSRHVDIIRGSESLPIDQFHDVLNRPDMVREALAGDPEGRVAAAAAALDLDEADKPDMPMRIQALTSLDGNRVEGSTARLSLGIENHGDGKGYIELRLNDVLLEVATDAINRERRDAENNNLLRLQRRINLFPGENEISVTAFDEDGNVLSSKRLSIVRLRVPEEHGWQLIPQIGEVSSDFQDIRFSPDGRTLATGSTSRESIWLWDAASGRTLRSLTGRSDGVGRFVYSPDSQTIAAESFNLSAEIWDVETGQMLRVLDQGNYEVEGTVTFSPDGRLITTSDNTGNVRLWDATTGRILHQLEAGADLLIIEYSPDGRLVATGARDNIRLWDAATGSLLRELDGIVDYSSSIRFDPSGLTVAAGSAYEATVRLWDTSTGRELNAPDVLPGRSGKDEITRLAFSPDGSIVATGSIDGTVLLQEMATGLEVSVLDGHVDPVTNIVFNRNGLIIATSSKADGSVRLWNGATGRQLQVLEGHVDGTTDIAFSPDGKIVATVSGDATGRIWEVETGRELHVLNSLADAISEVALSPDGRVAAQGNYDGLIRLWDIEKGVHLGVIDAHEDYVSNIEFSPDGRLLMSRTFEGTKRAWDITRDYEPSPEENLPDFTDTETSPDGRYSVMVGTEGWLHLSDRNGSKRYELFGHTAQITAAEFSPDSRTLMTGSWDSTARLWETATGHELQILEGHAGSVEDVAFGADGQMALTGSSDGTSRLWETSTGREVAQFVSFADGSWIVLTPEGFFNASEDGARYLHLVRGLDVLSVDQVFDALFRPDLVREALAGDPDGKVAAAAARLDLDKVLASGLPPQVIEVHSLDGAAVDGDVVEVSAEIEDRGGG